MKRKREGDSFKKATAKSTLAKLFELPESSFPGSLHIELSENHEAVIEGCRGVLEYGERLIRISTGNLIVTFRGENLSMGGMDHCNAVVSGNIFSIEFSN